MSDLTPETLAELQRLYEVAFAVGAPENEWEEWTSKAAEAFPALLDAAAERDALAAKLDAVRALHGPRVVQVLGATCSAEECDHEDACRLGDGDCTCPNPYRTKGETDE